MPVNQRRKLLDRKVAQCRRGDADLPEPRVGVPLRRRRRRRSRRRAGPSSTASCTAGSSPTILTSTPRISRRPSHGSSGWRGCRQRANAMVPRKPITGTMHAAKIGRSVTCASHEHHQPARRPRHANAGAETPPRTPRARAPRLEAKRVVRHQPARSSGGSSAPNGPTGASPTTAAACASRRPTTGRAGSRSRTTRPAAGAVAVSHGASRRYRPIALQRPPESGRGPDSRQHCSSHQIAPSDTQVTPSDTGKFGSRTQIGPPGWRRPGPVGPPPHGPGLACELEGGSAHVRCPGPSIAAGLDQALCASCSSGRTFGGRPRLRFWATIFPCTNSSPPHTPHGSRRSTRTVETLVPHRAPAAKRLGGRDVVELLGEEQLRHRSAAVVAEREVLPHWLLG